MNLDKMYNLAISAAKTDPSPELEQLVQMIRLEIESQIAKSEGRKNIYKNILTFIKKAKVYHPAYGAVFQNGERWAVTNGHVGVMFAGLEIKDLPISEMKGPDLEGVLKQARAGCVSPVEIMSETELKAFYKMQLAERESSSDNPIIRIGNNFYRTEFVVLVYSVMEDIDEARENAKTKMLYLKDRQGNEAAIAGLQLGDKEIERYNEKYHA